MAQIPNMNYDEIEAAGEYKPAPVGDYKLVVTESDIRPTKAGTGTTMQVKFEIIDGTQKGKSWNQWFNLVNPNDVAQRIGQAEFKALAIAVGLDQKPRDSSELHNKPFLGHVIIEDSGQYKNNRVQSFTRLTAAPAPIVDLAGQTIGAPAKKPWEQ